VYECRQCGSKFKWAYICVRCGQEFAADKEQPCFVCGGQVRPFARAEAPELVHCPACRACACEAIGEEVTDK